MSHAQIMAMLHRQVAADGGAMSGGASAGAMAGAMSGGASAGAMAGAMSGGAAAGLAKYHAWKAQQPMGLSRAELKAAWRHHKAVAGGYVGAKPVNKYFSEQALDALGALKRARHARTTDLKQYYKGNHTTAELHQALAALGVPEAIYSKTKVGPKPRDREAKPKAVFDRTAAAYEPAPKARAEPEMAEDVVKAYLEGLDPAGAGLAGGRRYRRY